MSVATSSPRYGPVWALVLLAVAAGGWLGVHWFAHNGAAANAADMPFDQFVHRLDDGQIYKDDKHPLDLLIEEGSSIQTLTGFYSDQAPARDHLDRLQPFRITVSSDYDQTLKDQLKRKGLTPVAIRDQSNLVAATSLNFLPLLVFAVVFSLLLWVFRRLLSAPGRRPDPAAPH